jgi:hypothetical protein
MILVPEYFEQFHGYEKFENPIEFPGCKCLGYFQYNIALLSNPYHSLSTPELPRVFFSDIEEKLIVDRRNIVDNKTVFIFENTTVGAYDFALNFTDGVVRIGLWEHIKPRGAVKFMTKEEYSKILLKNDTN